MTGATTQIQAVSLSSQKGHRAAFAEVGIALGRFGLYTAGTRVVPLREVRNVHAWWIHPYGPLVSGRDLIFRRLSSPSLWCRPLSPL